MMRQLTAAIFLMVFMVQAFNKPFILLDYYANTASFAKNCINKSIPRMHCNGKCQVMKKMQEEEKKDQKEQDRKADNKVEIFSLFPNASLYIFSNQPLTKQSYSLLIPKKAVAMPHSSFHPPSVEI